MNSYDKRQIEALASQNGFIRDNIEKVIRLSDVLSYIDANSFLSESLALKGGTAINLSLFSLPRLSVDIDLDFCCNCTREYMEEQRSAIVSEILSWMQSQGYTLNTNTRHPLSLDSWVFNYRNCGGNTDSIKIEINYSNRCHILPLERRQIAIDFLSCRQILTIASLELIGSKIKALIERSATRDLYDVDNIITSGIIPKEEVTLLRKIVVFYLCMGNGVPKDLTVFPNIDAITFRDIKTSLLPVLKKGTFYDYVSVKTRVTSFLVSLMRLSTDELHFINEFESGSYHPEILFDNPDILSRIEKHPMALWKTKR